MEKERVEVLDIFAGIGGMTQAFLNAGFTEVCGIEPDAKKADIYKRNFQNACLHFKIGEQGVEDLPQMEILTGRIPAYGYGIRKSGSRMPLDGGRDIYETLYDVILHKCPQAFLFEIKDRVGSLYQKFTRDLCELGYKVEYRIIDTAAYGGITGKYLYIIGLKHWNPQGEIWPKPVAAITGAWIERQGASESYYAAMRKYGEELPWRRGAVYCWKNGEYHETDKVSWNMSYLPLVCDDRGIRRITHKELQRLQGFADSYHVPVKNKAEAYRYLAGASNVRVCSEIARSIKWNLATGVSNVTVFGESIVSKPKQHKKVSKEKQRVKKCFVIMPFEKTLDGYYSKLIKPTLESMGYQVKRADEIYGTRPIIDDITSEIEGADILVADATGKNPNVNYELGYAHAKGKKVIIITQNVTDIPFDYRHRRAIIYHPVEVDWQEKLKNDLIKTVETVENREAEA